VAIPAAAHDTLYTLLNADTASLDFRAAMGGASAETLLTAYTDLRIRAAQSGIDPATMQRTSILRGAILAEMDGE